MTSLFNQNFVDTPVNTTFNDENEEKVIRKDVDVKPVKESNEKDTTVYRFKFSSDIVSLLSEFSKIHQHDNRDDYKDAWDNWCSINNDAIVEETKRLEKLGYKQNINISMYRSARYYYRNKSTSKTVEKKRRVYVPMNKTFLQLIDDHLYKYDNLKKWRKDTDQPMKPSVCYDSFCEEHANTITEETKRLISCGINKEDVEGKLKKTYKNRYFIYKKSS